jgi:hypothetical protein
MHRIRIGRNRQLCFGELRSVRMKIVQARKPCFPNSFTVLAWGPFSPISSTNMTRVPTVSFENFPSRTLFRWK